MLTAVFGGACRAAEELSKTGIRPRRVGGSAVMLVARPESRRRQRESDDWEGCSRMEGGLLEAGAIERAVWGREKLVSVGLRGWGAAGPGEMMVPPMAAVLGGGGGVFSQVVLYSGGGGGDGDDDGQPSAVRW